MGIHPYVVNVEGVAAESETNNAGGFYVDKYMFFIDFEHQWWCRLAGRYYIDYTRQRGHTKKWVDNDSNQIDSESPCFEERFNPVQLVRICR